MSRPSVPSPTPPSRRLKTQPVATALRAEDHPRTRSVSQSHSRSRVESRRELHCQRRATARRCIVDYQRSSVALDDAVSDGEPRPAPPLVQVRAESRRTKRSKTRSRPASGIPEPSSVTVSRWRALEGDTASVTDSVADQVLDRALQRSTGGENLNRTS